MADESGGGTGGSSGGSGTGTSGGGDISDIINYLNHRSFGADGDFTGNGGYGGDNTGPVGSKEPEKDDNGAVALLNAITAVPDQTFGRPVQRAGEGDRSREIEPYTGARAPKGSLFAFVGQDLDPYSGLALGNERIDPFTGTQVMNPFIASGRPARAGRVESFATIRRRSLLSSRNLIASNGPIVCDSRLVECPPVMSSDFNQSSLENTIQAEMDSHNATVLNAMEGKAPQIATSPTFDVHAAASAATRVTQSGEYQLALQVNRLRDHPLEVQRSGVTVGLGQMALGGLVLAGTALADYGSGGLAHPLIGTMGLASGIAYVSSGFVLAISGASYTDAVKMGDQLEQAFALTASPTRLLFGTTGLVLSRGNADVAQGYANLGGIGEDLVRMRFDPSKLYAGVPISTATKAEKGAAILLVKDVAALGHTARAEDIGTIATKLTRDFTVDDLNAIAAFRKEMAISGRLDLAGQAGHVASGAAGSGGGVDFIKYGASVQDKYQPFIQELKLHGEYTWLAQWYLDKASTQSLNYSIKMQLETRALGEQLIPIRSVKHIWISPTEAVKYVGD